MKYSSEYINQIIEKYKTDQAGEHAYRTALEKYFENITGLNVINEPRRSEYGAPDFVFVKDKIILAYAEAKDVGVSLNDMEKTEQITRYYGYSNLILTDYFEFRFFRNGKKYGEPVKIAELARGKIYPLGENFSLAEDTIKQFIQEAKEPIKSGVHLAKVMAGKARRIRDNIKIFLKQENDEKNENLLFVYEVIKKLLLADLNKEKFADMYAQTVVYGLFVARYYDETPDTFSRQEARDLVPASNPFLRSFFDHIAGSSFDPRIEIIVNELCEEFNHADVQAIVHNYYKVEKDDSRDPIIHFYEDFLQEYDSLERKKMGVFYTPLPVVRFIVRAIDDILKKEFDLPLGLADSSKIEIKKEIQGKKYKDKIHRVQILDPATGTGTFLNETIARIKKSFAGQEGRWNNYVNEDLLPRLHGFELMMASYTIAHLKLSSTIKESGVKIGGKTRLGVYLTNSLERGEDIQRTLFDFGFGKAIAEESIQANKVKSELPIMVVLGNPPYTAISSNKQASGLVEEYKVEPGGKVKLKERKNWLDDDYVKFISFAERLIDKNGEGILAYITNNGFIDNPTFRGMRWHLLKTFNNIYILDLHGNSKKKEKSPDGSKDKNVFNIMQGVSINIFVKKDKSEEKEELGNIYHIDLYGKRESKFDFLNKNNLESIKWNKINTTLPNLFFVNKGNIKDEEQYNQGFSIGSSVGGLFIKNSCGVVTMGDNFIVDIDKDVLTKRLSDFLSNDISEANLKAKYELGKNYANWVIENKAKIKIDDDKIIKFSYRPFDDRFTVFDKNLIWRTRESVMKDICENDFSMVFEKIAANKDQPVGIFLSKNIIDCHLTGGQSYIGNLYSISINNEKVSNLNPKIVNKIEKAVGEVEPEDILDYVYAVLHAPSYREKYKEFLKIDFPRVPHPDDKDKFKKLAALGRELRELHLLESPKLNNFITTFPEAGSGTIEKKFPKYMSEKVYINESQYFGGIPELVWNFYIGGYQPAQKWLKDRQGRKLTNADIEHYQKIIIAINETIEIMKKIDTINL